MATPESMLCKNLPQEFYDAMLYVRGLEFEEKPNYEMIRNKFKTILSRVHPNRKEELVTDWQLLRKIKKEKKKGEEVRKQAIKNIS